MEYENLYIEFKSRLSEGKRFFSKKEQENSLDGSDGIHVFFGMVVFPYIVQLVTEKNTVVLKKVFDFMEDMSVSENEKINEVLDFTFLEQIIDTDSDLLTTCKMYMKENTLQHCKTLEQYFGIQGLYQK